MSLPQSPVGTNSLPIHSNLPDKETLWQQTYLEAFQKNYESVQRWTRWKEDHEQVKSTLSSLPDKLSHEVVIPFGSKALVKAKLVHTNEVLTCIGSSYFVRQSAKQGISMCERRISQSDEMLTNLDKERTLLSNRQTLPKLEEAFAPNDTKEIIEEYNEETEAEWRRKHKEREADYRRKLRELRKRHQEQPPLQTEEDIFRRLDELELEEELNDELERLHAEYEADYENSDDEDDVSGESTEDDEAEDEESDDANSEKNKSLDLQQNNVNSASKSGVGRLDSMVSSVSDSKTIQSNDLVRVSGLKSSSSNGLLQPRDAWSESSSVQYEAVRKNRRISFADEAQGLCVPPKDNIGEEELDKNIYIRFRHSKEPSGQVLSQKVGAPASEGEIPMYLTPADIYETYKALSTSFQLKPILKKSSSYPDKFQDDQRVKPIQTSASLGSNLSNTFSDSEDSDVSISKPIRDLSHLPPVLCDVQESKSSVPQPSIQETSQRPVSRFKLARQSGKKL